MMKCFGLFFFLCVVRGVACSQWSDDCASSMIGGPYVDMLVSQNLEGFKHAVKEKWMKTSFSPEYSLDVFKQEVLRYASTMDVDHWFAHPRVMDDCIDKIEKDHGREYALDALYVFADYVSLEAWKKHEGQDKHPLLFRASVSEMRDGLLNMFEDSLGDFDRHKAAVFYTSKGDVCVPAKKVSRFFCDSDSPVLQSFQGQGGFMYMAEWLVLVAQGYMPLPMPNLEGYVHEISAHGNTFVGYYRMVSHDKTHANRWVLYKESRFCSKGLSATQAVQYALDDVMQAATLPEKLFKIFVYYQLWHEVYLTSLDSLEAKEHQPYIDYFVHHGLIPSSVKRFRFCPAPRSCSDLDDHMEKVVKEYEHKIMSLLKDHDS